MTDLGSLGVELLLAQAVNITSIENKVLVDEEAAIVNYTFGDEKLMSLWTYTSGFSVPVFVDNQRVLNHVEQELIAKTEFIGYEAQAGFVGLTEVGKTPTQVQ